MPLDVTGIPWFGVAVLVVVGLLAWEWHCERRFRREHGGTLTFTVDSDDLKEAIGWEELPDNVVRPDFSRGRDRGSAA
jgi:hypothetical protein